MNWSVDEPEPRGRKSPGVGKGTVGSWDCMRQPQPGGELRRDVQLIHLAPCKALGMFQVLPLENNFTKLPEALGCVRIQAVAGNGFRIWDPISVQSSAQPPRKSQSSTMSCFPNVLKNSSA